MTPSNRRTLTQYLIEQRRRFPNAGGALNELILDVSLACKAIARTVAFGALGGRAADGAGAAAASLGRTSQEAFVGHVGWSGNLAGMASALDAAPLQIAAGVPRGKYLLVFDALDGAGRLDVNVPVGSLFSILRAPADAVDSGRPVVEADFLQPGSQQVAAGYALYGPATMLVLTVGNGVVGFTLDPDLGDFRLTHDHFGVPADAREFAINTATSRNWEPPVKRYVDECLAGRNGPRGHDFDMRWVASTVADAHRILVRGGVFLHPRDTRQPDPAGSLGLLFEANPIALLMEQAGGRASTGRQPVLGVPPRALHQPIGTVFGSRHEVERIERYHRDPAMREAPMALFAERSLFRE
jgi:fructose-1,6-bisphosphatase I/sedoheptulose-1,7-bisphosphatase